MLAKRVVVTRDVAASEEHNYAGRVVEMGEFLWTFHLTTYGCVDTQEGIALSEEPDTYPFFEFPVDAVELVEDE